MANANDPSSVSLFFASHLIIFFFLFNVEERSPITTRAFFIWVNVFNMFIVSLFWSFMNDLFSREQSKRLFAFIAAGGTAGAICGPIVTASLVKTIGLGPLLLVSAVVLAGSVVCVNWLTRWNNSVILSDEVSNSPKNAALKGGSVTQRSVHSYFQQLIYRSMYLHLSFNYFLPVD